ncbi:fibrocystin isoform X8 [Mustela lutreola]|uniref:fibrocystin isoform X8 n=1 Tax=Mustela lutreola TaxID=9666 RepID=UPI0027975007|nr:fibrocystin isoform X8 [Mustela lutreola]
MTVWLISLMSMEILLLAVPSRSFHIEPEEGSLAGGTWITVIFDGLESEFLYSANGAQLEIHLVNVAEPSLPSIPCDVSPVFLDLPVVMCRTRSLLSEAHEGLYYLEVHSGGQVVGSPSPGPRDNCMFKFSRAQTPIVYQVTPPSGAPGKLIHVYGWIITGRSETFDFEAEYIESPLIMEAQGDKWVTACSLVNRQTGSRYPLQEDHGLGTLQCRVEGNYIGSQNVSFSVFNKGKSIVHKNAWMISAKLELFLYQTHSEILSVFPDTGSLGGRTDITITGDFFDNPVQVTIAGIPCDIRDVSPRKIECTTRAPGKSARLTAPQAGNRGLLFEVGEAVEGLDLTSGMPGYQWQIVPNASSPPGFWSKEGLPFRARLSGFFVAPETNNYTFWIQADNQASLYFSHSEDPKTKVKVASIKVGIADWFDAWEQNGHDGTWQRKTPKLELVGGTSYYLEAEHGGRAPSRGMRIGVQIHNTWLNPDVVSTYLREKQQIRIHAQRLPEIQMLTVSGRGSFVLTWDNVTSQPIPGNVTAHQIQRAIEELLAVKCKLEPLSASSLLWLGFEQGPEGSSFEGDLTSGTEPFCGRFSLHQPRHLVLIPPASQEGYQLDQYTQLCLAYKGHKNNILKVTVFFTTDSQNFIKKNITCDWSLVGTSPDSWRFTCTDLWETCVHGSVDLQPALANSSVLVYQIDLFPLSQETRGFYVDEIIIADTNITVSQADSETARPGGNLVESLCVEGSPPVYNVSFWLVGCGRELPLITASSVPTEGGQEESGVVQVTTQRIQKTSPPLGGYFRIQLPTTEIPDIPVHVSASDLRKLLQNNADNFTSRYLNVNDFAVTEDLKSCYEHVWTLSWSTQVGDLPNFIRVSDAHLTGVDPAAAMRVVYDGGVFLGPIFGDMLVTANQHTQVVVRVNDIPAHCSGSCSFQYLEESTPQVHLVWYSLGMIYGDIHLLVYIFGTSFSGDPQAVQVTVNKTICRVLFSNETNVVCQTDLLPVGMHRLSVVVRPSGCAINASGEALFLNVEPRLVAVEPSRAAEIGGLWATIQGSGLEDVSLVLFGSRSCAIDITRSNSQRIQCKVPPRGKDGPIVNLTVITGDHSAVLPMAFTYDSSLNPVIISLSRNRSNIAGGETLSIRMALLGNYSDLDDLDVEVHVQDTLVPAHVQMPHSLEVVLPPLPPGLHRISVSINGVSICSRRVDLHIQYVTDVFSIEPCCGSLLGGTILTVSGVGFSRDPNLVWVLVGNRTCDIVNSTDTVIWCETPPSALLPKADIPTVPAPLEVWAGNASFVRGPLPSLVGKGFTFMYEVARTPVVTAVQGEMTNNSLRLSVEGNNLPNSVILLGFLNCDLEMQSLWNNMSLSGCSFPLHSLEAGTYPLQVRQKQMGFANMSAVPQQFVMTPRIMAILPTHGSACGGTVLTVRGLALNSRKRSVQVHLSGPFSCVILSLGDQTVLCQISQVDAPLPNASFTLNITVLVNGLPSECQGLCTLSLREETTPIVDSLTTNISGSLTMVLIRGQKLDITTDEPMVFVDNHLPCVVTFFNASHVACRISDLTPGLHYVSIFHTRIGYACFGNVSRHFHILPEVSHYFPKNFSIHGGSLLSMEGIALRGENSTLVFIGQQACLTVSISSKFIQCIVPAGNGSGGLVIEVDGLSYRMGVIGYSNAFTPQLLSISQTDDILTMVVAQVSGAKNVDIFIGMSPCAGVSGNYTVLQCVVPPLPAGEYPVRGYDRMRGWASSVLVFTSTVTISAVTENFGCLGGSLVHVFGGGFSPGNISAAVCGAPCQVLANATVSAFSCLVPPLDVSLAFLCGLKHAEESCEASSSSYVQCDLTFAVGTETLPQSWPYLYICEESPQCLFAPDHWTESAFPWFSGLFLSPKVERDEVLIYNSSCNIAMETEAKMECETPNQPITAKITEIWKSRGQNTQGSFSFHFCRRWSRAHSWFPERVPQDGDNVTVENGHSLLLDTNTSILSLLHVKGGKLIFMDAGPIELRAHSILISDGGELWIGSEDKPFQGKAEIKLYGSSHSTPFFPYGVKFLAVRNGTLSLHGLLPEVTITHLRAAASARDTVLALEDAVDWCPGDEVVIISGIGFEGAKPTEEIVIVEAVHKTDLHLRSPLRYSHNFTESWVAGERHILKVTVVLLSRRVTIQGNLTAERKKHLASCQEASASEGNLQDCFYSKSEKILGSRDLGARVIVQSFAEEPSRVQLKGVQFRALGQAFRKHLSSLTLVGVMRDSYIQGCTVWSSFSRGLSMSRTLGLKVDSNVFYNILGHTLLVGTNMDVKYMSWEATPEKTTEQGNIIRNNVIISVSGTEGLSSPETLTPSGIYIRNPTNIIEGNRVYVAGLGYFFHLVTSQTSQAPLLSFTQNIAHSCTRSGLFIYPQFRPPWDNGRGPTLFQNFTVWGSAGGAQIFRSSNLHLKNFQVYSCRDFGIDILESDANTSITDSLLLGHFAHKGSLCMSAGIKTPKRWELIISNTTFVNFDLTDCVAIRTCAGCSRGQGGFTVKTNQLKFINSPNLVAFPFTHAAILEDLDGSLSGKNRSHILASMETLPASCLVNESFSQIVHGSVCGEDVLFHRMSIGLANVPDVSYDLTMTDSRNKTTTVNYVHDTLSNLYGWMALLLDQETYSLQFDTPWINSSLQYSATFGSFIPGNYLLLVHTVLWPYPDIHVRCGNQVGRSLPSLPSPGRDQGCDWFFNTQLRQLTYLVSGEGHIQVTLQVKEGVPPTISASTSAPESAFKWSLPEAWTGIEEGWGGHNHTIPGPGDDVLILPNRTVLVDTNLPVLRGLYVMGTLEFPVDRSNVLSVACMVIAGGELKVGTLENPLEKEQKLLILLRASEGVSCDRFNGILIDPGTIGIYGKVQLHGACPKKSWTRLAADIASGNERIIVQDTVDWRPHDKIVLSSSSYEPHEAEVLTVKEAQAHHVKIHEQLKHRHVGSVHVMEDGRSIRLAAEVGLLTRNIQIQPDISCRVRLLVGSFRKSSSEEFSGVLQLSNVEIQNFGSPLYSAVELLNASAGTWIISSTLHQSCGGGIRVAASHGIILKDNLVFGAVGHGIDLQDVTFSSFVKSCYSDDLDVCILPSVENTGIMHPIIAERTKMLKIKDKNKFYFPPLQARKGLEMLVCPESDCENPRKYLFKDLDGRALGLPPPVSVFPKMEAEWTGSFFNTGTFREEQKCTYRALIQGYICKQTDQVILILDNVDATWAMRKLYPVVSITRDFVDTFSGVNFNTPCSASGSVSTFYSILPTREITKVCFVEQPPQVLRFFLLGNKSASKLLLAIFYHEFQSPRVFIGESFIPPILVQSTSSLLDESLGSNYFSILDNLLYVVLQGPEPIEIRSGVSIHLALTVTFSVLEKGWEIIILERLTDFLQVRQDQIRFIYEMSGNEATLKAIADNKAKRKRNCPTVSCASHYRVGQRKPLMMEMSSYSVPPTMVETVSKVIVIEIGDLPTIKSTGLISYLSSNKLQNLAHQIITAQQTGVLENVLNMTVGALLVTQSKGVTGYGNTSSSKTENLIYIRPYALSVLVQPSDGEVGKELTVQPRLVFLDKQNRRIESLGPPSEPWTISVSLEGTSDSVLKGCTRAESQDGYVSFSNLAVLISGSNWHFLFTVTSPPGVNFTARSRSFTVLPVRRSEKSTIILAASLCSVASWLALCCLVCCWLKKSKSRKIKSEDISEFQTNSQKNHIHISSKHPRSQETKKEDAMMGEEIKMKVIVDRLNQLPHQSLNGVSRRKVGRRAAQEEGGRREEVVAPAPSITGVTSQGHTCAPGSPAQQVYLQETGTWKEAQEQLVTYQMAGQDQRLLLCPDLRQEREQMQGQTPLSQERGHLGLSQEKKASCGATQEFCPHSVHLETIQEQL